MPSKQWWVDQVAAIIYEGPMHWAESDADLIGIVSDLNTDGWSCDGPAELPGNWIRYEDVRLSATDLRAALALAERWTFDDWDADRTHAASYRLQAVEFAEAIAGRPQ